MDGILSREVERWSGHGRQDAAHDGFDWSMADNKPNKDALHNLCTQKPECLALNVDMLAGKNGTIALGVEPEHQRQLSVEHGNYSFMVSPEAARAFESYCLNSDNRNEEGVLLDQRGEEVNGYTYESLAVPRENAAQSIRTATIHGSRNATSRVPRLPGLETIAEDICERGFGLPKDAWKKLVRALHGLVQDWKQQVAFSWHEDSGDLPRYVKQRRQMVTVVVACSAETTAMRILGFKPFVYGERGMVSAFPGMCIHQSIPWAMRSALAGASAVEGRPEGAQAIKVAFFFEAPPPSEQPPRAPSQMQYHVMENNHEWLDYATRFVDRQRLQQFIDADKALPPSRFTYMKESALWSLNRSLEARLQMLNGKPPDGFARDHGPEWHYFIATTDVDPTFVRGIVWYLSLTTTAWTVWCIAAQKTLGHDLHEQFCEHAVRQGCQCLHAPLAKCKVANGPWLRAHGWTSMEGAALADGAMMIRKLNRKRGHEE